MEDITINEFYNEHRCSYINLIHYLDANSKESKMCVSNMECKQIEDAWKIGDWKTIIKYINKYI